MTKMTPEEAVEVLKSIIPKPQRGDSKSTTHLLITEALCFAIDTIEQSCEYVKWLNEMIKKSEDAEDDFDYGMLEAFKLCSKVIDKEGEE